MIRQQWRADYLSLLDGALRRPAAELLGRAAELGALLLRHSVSPAEIVAAHQAGVERLGADDSRDLAGLWRQTLPLLAEVMRAYGQRLRAPAPPAAQPGRAAELLRVQRDLGVALSSTSDLGRALDQALEAALRIEGFDSGAVYLVDGPSGALSLHAHRGLGPDFVARVAHYEADTPNARLVSQGRPVYGLFAQLCPRSEEALTREGLRALAVIPVRHEGQLVAALNLASHTSAAVPAAARDAAEAIAAQIGGAIARIRSETGVRASEERFRQMAENIHEVFWISDSAAEQVLYVSPAYEQIWQRSCANLYRRPGSWMESIHPEDRPRLKAFQERKRSGRVASAEFRIVRPDGSLRWIASRAFPIRDQAGRLFRIVGVAEDITERKQAELALRDSEAKFRTLAETLSAAVFIYQGTRMRYVNRAAERLTGYSRAELVGAPFWRFVHPDFRALVKRRGLARQRGEDVPGRYEAKILTKSGQSRWLDLSASRMTYRGRPAGLTTAFDITDRKRAEQEAQRHRAELAHVSRLNLIGQMAAGLAHELNQPLSTLLFYTRACVRRLRAGALERGELIEVLGKVAEQAARAGALLHRLGDFVRNKAPRPAPLDINRLIRAVVSFGEFEARERRISVRLGLAPGLPPVQADRVQIEQVVLNLVRNGIEAMQDAPGRRELAISSATADAAVVVAVADTGRGLSPETAARAFDPFFSTKPDGMGMGLWISRSIIEAHGGRLWMTANGQRGSTAQFTLPLKGTPDG